MAPHVACLLLREKMLPWLATLHTTVAPEAAVHEAGETRAIARLMTLVKGAVGSWPVHRYDWYVHGAPTGQAAPSVRPRADQDQISYQEGVAYVEQLAQAYTWCLLPWGVSSGGQILLLAADAATLTTLLAWLQGGSDRMCADLLVSTYTPEDVRTRRFRGAIFGRSGELQGHGLWHDGRGASTSALVLCSASEESPLVLPANVEVVYQVHVRHYGPVTRTWLRIYDEAALLEMLPYTSLVTAGDLDDQWMRTSLGHFAQTYAYICDDPLYFGLHALQSASWIYLPDIAREHWEVYLNNDPAMTGKLLYRVRQMPSPWFLHKTFF